MLPESQQHRIAGEGKGASRIREGYEQCCWRVCNLRSPDLYFGKPCICTSTQTWDDEQTFVEDHRGGPGVHFPVDVTSASCCSAVAPLGLFVA